ncbi:hypothetical protein [Streptomyces tendae]
MNARIERAGGGLRCAALSASGPVRRTDAELALLSAAVVAAATELGARLG